MNKNDLYKREDKRIREDWFKNHVAKIHSFDNGNLLKIKWADPSSWNFAIIYLIDVKLGHLCVFGDLGEAVYHWYPPVSINFLGGCNLDYFDSKCQASSCGERGKVWNHEVAVSYLKEYIEDHTIGEDKGDSFYETLWSDGYADELIKTHEPDLSIFLEEETCKFWSQFSLQEKEKFIKIAKLYMENLASSIDWRKLSKHDYRRELIESQKKFEDLGPDAINACESEHAWHHWLTDNGYEFFGDDYYEFSDIGNTISSRIQSHLIGLKMIKDGIEEGKFKIIDTEYPIVQIYKSLKYRWKLFLNWFSWKSKEKAQKRVKGA